MTVPIAQNSYAISSGTTSNSPLITLFRDYDPTSNDTQYKPTQRWVNTSTNAEFILVNFTTSQGVVSADWEQLSAGAGNVQSLTADDSGIATPSGGTITVSGGSTGLTTTASSSTLSVTGTLNVAHGGTGATSLSAHTVLVGNGTSAITQISPSTAGFIMTSNGVGSDPSFQAASASGAITSITGNSGGAQVPSSGNFNVLGSGSITTAGTANTETISLTGLTNHSILLGAGTATINPLAVGASSTVLVGNTGADPSFSATPTVTSITFGSGNALNKYVTGTWTPGLAFGGASTGITYSVQTGFYTQIGNAVYISAIISLTSKGSDTGNATITGLPVSTGTNAAFFFIPIFTEKVTLDATYTTVSGQFSASGTTIGINESGSGSLNYQPVTDSMFANTSKLLFTGFYLTV